MGLTPPESHDVDFREVEVEYAFAVATIHQDIVTMFLGESREQADVLLERHWLNIRHAQTLASRWAACDDLAARTCSVLGREPALLLRIFPAGYIATDWVKPALEAARRLGDEDAEALHLHDLGVVAFAAEDAVSALDYFDQAYRLYTVRANEWYAIDSLIRASGCRLILGDIATAILGHERALACIEALEPSRRNHLSSNVWQGLARAHLAAGDADKAREDAEKSLSEAKAHHCHSCQGTAWMVLSSIYESLDGPSSGRAAEALFQAGEEYFRYGSFRLATGLYKSAAEAYRTVGDAAAVDRAWLHMRDAAERHHRWHRQSHSHSDVRGAAEAEILAMASLTVSLVEHGRSLEAEAQALKSLELARRVGSPTFESAILDQLATVYHLLGTDHLRSGEVDLALEALEKGLKIVRDRPASALKFELLFARGIAAEYLVAVSRFRNPRDYPIREVFRGAIDHFEQAVAVGRALHAPDLETRASQALDLCRFFMPQAEQPQDT